MDTNFFPSAARARTLNQRMNAELGRSLQYVCEQAENQLDFDSPALAELCQHLQQGEDVAPYTFGLYYQLVQSIELDDVDAALLCFQQLSDPSLRAACPSLIAFGSGDRELESRIYAQKWAESLDDDVRFGAPTADSFAAFKPRLDAGLALLKAATPELYGEIRAIIRQFVIIGKEGESEYQVDGGSHYQLWGALFLNGQFHPDRIAVAEVLAHESAHSLLFGFCTDEPLTLNDEDARYPSPLRHDLRPMDGIYHATFVSARMHWAMTALASSEVLSKDEKTRALNAAALDRRNFEAGYSVIAEHGDLTGLGRDLMAHARAYISGE